MPDPVHMIKLARNSFAVDRIMTPGFRVLSWKSIKDLFDLQERMGLKLGTSLTKLHVIDWEKNKMKVRTTKNRYVDK